MILLWVRKRYLARALDSTMAGEATCSLSCIQITLVVFLAALVFKITSNAWWVDNAACIVLSLLSAREVWNMLRWMSNPESDGGCCGHCAHPNHVRGLRVGRARRSLGTAGMKNKQSPWHQRWRCVARLRSSSDVG